MENRLQVLAQLKQFSNKARAQGATHLTDEACRPNEIEYDEVVHSTGCGNTSLFDLPVEGEDFKRDDPARVCAHDDLAYLFPRYS